MEFSKIIEKGLALGISEIEIYAQSTESNNIKLLKGKVETYNLSKLNSLTIRGLYNGKMAVVSTENVNEETDITGIEIDYSQAADEVADQLFINREAMYEI